MIRNFTAFAATAAALALATQVHAAGTVVDAVQAPFQGNDPGVALFKGDSLDFNGSFATGFKADGLAYQGGQVFVSGVSTSGILQGGYLYSYDLAGNPGESLYGASFQSWGPLATGGGQVFAGVTTSGLDGAAYWLRSYNSDLTVGALNIELPEEITGVAFSGGGLFVSFGSNIRRYDLAGNLVDSHDYGVVDVTGLAFGANTLFASFTSGATHGWGAIDPAMLFASGGASVTTNAAITGMTFGDGGLYVSTEFSLNRYELNGDQTLFLDTTPVISHGPLAFIPAATGPRDPTEVPEPATWALMIAGFGAAGAMLRRRGAHVAA